MTTAENAKGAKTGSQADTVSASSVISVVNSSSVRLVTASGFSVMELLVVISVIAILVSLLLPAMSRAKQRAQSIECQNNLKQLQLAWIMYTGDHDGAMPPNEEGRPFGVWEGVRNSWVLGNAQQDDSSENIERGSLFSYVGNPDVYRCPSDQEKVVGHPDLSRFRSYSLNGELNHWIIADQM